LKAWEIEHNLRVNAKPDKSFKANWEGIDDFEKFYNNVIKLFWDSKVPGSGAPECLMTGAIQAVENMGKDVTKIEPLLEKGLKALNENNITFLRNITSEIFFLLDNAADIPDHPYHKFSRPLKWQEIALNFPRDKDYKTDLKNLSKRILGGWLGQIAGGAMGTFIEGYNYNNLLNTFGTKLGTYLSKPDTVNDDITYEIGFLLAYEKAGEKLTSKEIAQKWVSYIPFGWSAEYIALENLKRGIYPPLSGTVTNPFQEWIGAQMRCMVAGLVSPGKPYEAARLAFLDSQISHSGNGIYGGMHSAELTSLAFIYTDIKEIIEKSIDYIPEGTEFKNVVEKTIKWCKTYGTWEEVCHKTEEYFKKYNWIHLYPNTSSVITSLWFGNGDFNKTMKIVASFGFDVDCNAGEVGTILGVNLGIDGIDSKWYEPFKGILKTYVKEFKEIKIVKLADKTVNCATWNLSGFKNNRII